MFKQLLNKKLLKNEKGLTLIELLAVIVILAIIAAIAIPAIGNIIVNTRYNAVKADAINVINASNLYFTDSPDETNVTVEKLLEDKYLDSEGKFVKTDNVDKIAGGNELNTGAIEYSTGRNVTFDTANITEINDDETKGSAETAVTIGK